MSKNIVIVGSCMIDFSCYAPRLPKPGETLVGKRFEQKYGGKGANQCVTAARLGATTCLVAALGSDIFAQEYLDVLRNEKVDVSHVQLKPNSHSGIAQITVAENGENCIVIVPGSNELLSKKDVDDATEIIKNSQVLLCQFETPIETTLHALKIHQGHGAWSIVNGAPAIKNVNPEIFKFCDIFCVNETEVEFMTGIQPSTLSKAQEAVDELINRGCKIVIITLGSQGAVWASRDDRTVTSVPTVQVQSVDTTGAGDAFLGALAYFLVNNEGLSMYEIIRRACFVASQSVLKFGTQSSFPKRSELPVELFT